MSDRTGQDNDVDVRLRSVADVAARMIALAAVVRRCAIELDPQGDAEGERFDLAAWLREEHVLDTLTPDERRIVSTRVGGLDPDVAEDGSWRFEALAALAWASGLTDVLSPYHLGSSPGDALGLVPEPWDKTNGFAHRLQLRDEELIAAAREEAELWYWRADLGDEDPDLPEADRAALRRVVREVSAEAARAGMFERPLGGDFPVDGRLFRDLFPEERELVLDVATERLRVFNWLCGFGSTWDSTPLEI